MKTFVKRFLILFMLYPLRILIKILPLKMTYLIGIVGGRVLYLISGEKHSIMAEELRCIMPDKNASEVEKIIRNIFKIYCISELEVLLYPVLNRSLIGKMVTIEGSEHLDNSLLKGKGVVLFQAHFGAFQMIMPALGYSGYRMNQISASAALWKDASTSVVQKKMFDLKAKYEYTLPVCHMPFQSFIRPAFRALENNEIVGVTIDGGGGRKTSPVRFLGREANFQQGGASIAIKTGAAIVPVFIITGKDLKHRIIIHPPVKADKTQSKIERVRSVLQEFGKILESYVYRYPAHYGYFLYLRKARAVLDPYPFFSDHRKCKGDIMTDGKRE